MLPPSSRYRRARSRPPPQQQLWLLCKATLIKNESDADAAIGERPLPAQMWTPLLADGLTCWRLIRQRQPQLPQSKLMSIKTKPMLTQPLLSRLPSPVPTSPVKSTSTATLVSNSPTTLTKIHNILRGTSINIGNNIEVRPAAAGGRLEITGDLIIDASDFVNAPNDGDAASPRCRCWSGSPQRFRPQSPHR